jgi:hypothetical protein
MISIHKFNGAALADGAAVRRTPEMQELMKRHVVQYPMAIGNLSGVTVPTLYS